MPEPLVIHHKGRTYRLGDGVCKPVPLPDWLPEILPMGWEELPTTVGRQWGRIYRRHRTLGVILSAAQYNDGKRWLHVSVSRSNGEIPAWAIMGEVKDLFIGPERTAIQVHPPQAKYVNIHKGVLHLWHCLDGDVTPDFTAGGETI